MKIGFSIEAPAFEHSDKQFIAGYNSFDEFIHEIKKAGVESIEIRKLNQIIKKDVYEIYNKSIQKIWDAGMEITIHGDMEENLTGKDFIEVYPSMAYILKKYNNYQNKLVMTLHALQEKTGKENSSSHQLKERTISLLKDWTTKIEKENLPIYFALENNRSKKSAIDPGNSCTEVFEMVNRVNHPNLGICWDMGHLYSNLLFGNEIDLKLGSTPPKEFIKKVYHTHIHGLNDEGITHYPLTEDYRLPIASYVDALKGVGYEGVYNLELSFDRFPENVSKIEEAIKSIKYLRSQ